MTPGPFFTRMRERIILRSSPVGCSPKFAAGCSWWHHARRHGPPATTGGGSGARPLSRCFPPDEPPAERKQERHREQRDPRLAHDLPYEELEGTEGQGEKDNRVEDGAH